MIRISVLIFILTMSLSAHSVDKGWQKYKIQNGCTLFDTKGFIKVYPGNFCVFLNDGSFISANDTAIRRISQKSEISWEKPGSFHHQINLTPDAKRLLVLSSEVTLRGKRKERDDIILILDIDGNELFRRSFPEILAELKLDHLNWAGSPASLKISAEVETSHLNSIYEIPANAQMNKAAYLRLGNIILNSSELGIFILSPDLKTILYHEKYLYAYSNAIHDVQVGSDGYFLLFNNMASKNGYERWSAIQKYDPVKEKIIFEWTSEPKVAFYSSACGGVQEIDHYIFFSHIVNGGFLYSKEERNIISAIPGSNGNPRLIVPTQQLKFVDVTEFLKKNAP